MKFLLFWLVAMSIGMAFVGRAIYMDVKNRYSPNTIIYVFIGAMIVFTTTAITFAVTLIKLNL